MTDQALYLYAAAICLFCQAGMFACDALVRAVEAKPFRAFGNAWAAFGAIIVGYQVWIAA